MAKWWRGIALCVGWLGISVSAWAQYPPGGDSPFPGGEIFPAQANPLATASDPAAPAEPPAAGAQAAPGAPAVMPGGMPCAAPAQLGVPVAPPVGTPTTSGGGPQNAFTENCLPKTPPNQFHANFEYLGWFLAKQPVPILVTSGSFSDPIPAALGQHSTKIVIDSVGSDRLFSGGQLTLAWDLDCEKTLTVDAGGFVLEHRTDITGVSSNGDPGSLALGRPFLNANFNINDADPVALPGVLKGQVAVTNPTRFAGGESNLRYNWWESGLAMERCSLLAGVRYLNLDEKLVVDDVRADLPGSGQQGNRYDFHDDFTTYNRFYGGQVGAEGEWRLGNLVLTLSGKVAVGDNDMTTEISGFTAIRQPGGNVSISNNRAVLVQPSNAGTTRLNRVGVVPAGEAYLGYDFNEYVRFSVGYSVLYWFSVLRPGNQIDQTLNIQSLQPFDQVGPARPGVPMQTSDFWAQGFNISLLISF